MSDINKIAQEFLAKNENHKEVYCTTDGQVFTSKNYASLHGRSLKTGKQKVSTITREEPSGNDLVTKAEDVISLIEASEDLELVKTYQAAEAARKKPRKTVTDTILAKIEDLTKEA